jgi:hypothetical protein
MTPKPARGERGERPLEGCTAALLVKQDFVLITATKKTLRVQRLDWSGRKRPQGAIKRQSSQPLRRRLI